MAEVTALRNNALPYPVYGAPWGLVFPILDADGDLVTGAASLDTEISQNGDTHADATNEATEIATSSGMYYLLLTASELTTDVLSGITKTATSGAKTTPWVLYPRKLPTVRSGTAASAGSATSTIVLDSGASSVDDFYNGMLVIATIDGTVEARVISDYVGSTKTASVVPDWNTAPDSDDTFVVKLPEGRHIQQSDVVAVSGGAAAADALESYLDGSEFMPVDAHKLKFTTAGGVQTVKKPDGTTTAYTKNLGTDPAAEPIISST